MANPPTDNYVDPLIAGDSGTGTLGDPYGDIQYALNSIVRNSLDGDRINVKAGTAELLTAAISLTTYGTPDYTAPLIFQGYTAGQGDGGQGQIDCGGFSVITNAGNSIQWYDMDISNGPPAGILLPLTLYGNAIRCYVHDSDGDGIVTAGDVSSIIGCRVEDIGDATHDMIRMAFVSCIVDGNYLKQGAARAARRAISLTSGNVATNNIVSVDGITDGIYSTFFGLLIKGNAILSNGGTGTGIYNTGGSAPVSQKCYNNYVEGFSGVGGIGFEMTTSSAGGGVYGRNAAYNNTTNYNQASEHNLELGDNEILVSTGLAKSGADSFANRFVYFSPADVGNMQTGGFPEA